MKELKYIFWVELAFCFLLEIIMAIILKPMGLLATQVKLHYYLGTLLVLISMGTIYVCTKMMYFNKIQDKVREGGFLAYKKYKVYSILFLGDVMMLNLVYYNLALESLGWLCFLMCLLAYKFVYPTEEEYNRLTNAK